MTPKKTYGEMSVLELIRSAQDEREGLVRHLCYHKDVDPVDEITPVITSAYLTSIGIRLAVAEIKLRKGEE